jgi:hypothetical protein
MTTKLARAAALVALLYAARRYYRNWGTTKDECQMTLPGDELVRRPATRTTEGVTIDAPAEAVWRQVVERHQPAMTIERVIDNRAVVLLGEPPDFPWRTVMSFHVLPRLSDRCRLLVRTRTELRHPGQVILVELAGPATAMLNRSTLLGIKHQAEAAEQLTPR